MRDVEMIDDIPETNVEEKWEREEKKNNRRRKAQAAYAQCREKEKEGVEKRTE